MGTFAVVLEGTLVRLDESDPSGTLGLTGERHMHMHMHACMPACMRLHESDPSGTLGLIGERLGPNFTLTPIPLPPALTLTLALALTLTPDAQATAWGQAPCFTRKGCCR